jgi:hypothetical protein
MKGLRIFLFLLALGSNNAWCASTSFRDAFQAHSKVRRLEEEENLLSARSDMEDDEKQAALQKVSAQLTQARIDFQAVGRMDGEKLSPWERQALDRILKGKDKKKAPAFDKLALSFLADSFPKARKLSPLEWQVVGEWFGPATQDAFLKTVFAMEEPPRTPPADDRSVSIVWVVDPFTRFLARSELERRNYDQSNSVKELRTLGYAVEELPVSPFPRIEDQAEELHLALMKRIERGEFVLISSGSASAILHRTLDINSGLLSRKEIRGWVNLNGQLFGQSDFGANRAPASARADRQLSEARQELLLLRSERLHSQNPFTASFPILNLVTFSGKYRPGTNLRESIVPEGRTYFLTTGNGYGALRKALPALDDRKPSGQRDAISGAGF